MIVVIGFDTTPSPQLEDIIDALQARFGAVTVTRLEFTPPIVPVPAPLPTPDPGLPVGAKVIDVSTWQGSIDWERVRYVGEIENAMIRATNGTVKDTRFSFNWRAAKQAGVKRGAYHYWQNEVSPQAQAQAFISAHEGDFGELGWALDIEDQQPPFTKTEMIDVRTWMDVVELATGKRGYIYTGRSVWNFPSEGWAKEYPLWMAAYSNSGYLPLAPWPQPSVWQHTSRGVLPGITANTVDLNTAGDGLTVIEPDWYWRGCTEELADSSGTHAPNFFIASVDNPMTIYSAPNGSVLRDIQVNWRMTVQAVTADGWLKVHQVGTIEWWVKAESVKLA